MPSAPGAPDGTDGADAVRRDSRGLLARLPGASRWELTVTDVSTVTPSMRRIRCTAPDLATFEWRPGQDLMLSVPSTPSGDTFRRRYTIRSFDRSVPAVDLDVVLHGDGPGAAWAAAAAPGDRIDAIGPRGKITAVPDADWHLFAGDDAALPASLAMAASLLDSRRALVVLEVDGPDDEQPTAGADGRPLDVRWLHRGGADPAEATNLVAALNSIALPSGRGQAYLAGELRAVAAMRDALVARGLDAAAIATKPYWRAGVANAAHGEPERA